MHFYRKGELMITLPSNMETKKYGFRPVLCASDIMGALLSTESTFTSILQIEWIDLLKLPVGYRPLRAGCPAKTVFKRLQSTVLNK